MLSALKIIQDISTMNFLVIMLSIAIWIIFQHDGGLLALFIGPLFLAVMHNQE